ncbi:MAG: methyltransferase domain-containing protein [Mesorhizobium sp.]|uniref:class I SAM-dependent methyltransferase n=1 Tax=Mesorhizobium sp. TaxID=1871066 RepID=UPI000FE6B231|nr:methyltransferase domain-containing protein [Mesorhizobium sp.]RWI10917.1 MAG: methyltransferase domain-containing protein [Mesorhizobium sp.]RWK44929.1 MAG: methyltransferase domain-containing protein [Mesorhizobium sp.]RWK87943.1 MAG: methyltransferase domain-containing protein [Mesorhizobium sp.]TIP56420.1 MAG: methyltransferase domain-containing protein [Mesorhizobium sp.]TIQ94991.1 MAG: methyltransferase domain-containing protein [Mesorhizobium sp.]
MAPDEQWQLEGTAAELYQRYLVPLITSLWAADLVKRSAPRPGEQVLDVACGTGVVARLAAEQMGTGRVVGLDLNSSMLAVARAVAQNGGPKVEWHEASVHQMPFPNGTFDVILCQLGLQFFPDRARALAEMFRVLTPGGRLALSVFTAIERTPVAHALADALDRYLAPGASSIKRSEHTLSDGSLLENLVSAAGFKDVTVTSVTQMLRFPSPRDYVRLQLSATPQAGMVADMDADKRDALIDAITGDLVLSLGGNATGVELVSPQECHVLHATR